MARKRTPLNEDSFRTFVEVWNEELGMTTQLGPYNVALHEVQGFINDVTFGNVKGFDKARLIVD
jgi:hypothetical protein